MTYFLLPGPANTERRMSPWQVSLAQAGGVDAVTALGSTNSWPFFQSPVQLPSYERRAAMLFSQCHAPSMGISEADFVAAAATLGAEVAAIKAVAQVETKQASFDALGRPTILFERHYFHRLTAGKFSVANPDISNATSGGYGKFSAQYEKLERAYRLDASAALQSASWGKFQIMGANFVAAGYGSVFAFVAAMMAAEANHLSAFVNFINADTKLTSALKNKDWTNFASRYNGPGYKKNKYDEQMKAAYEALIAAAPAQ